MDANSRFSTLMLISAMALAVLSSAAIGAGLALMLGLAMSGALLLWVW